MVKQLCILGSTGSIGTQTLDVVRNYPDRYSVYAICAHRSIDKLIEQAKEFLPEVVCIADESLYEELSRQLSAIGFQGKIWAGAQSIAEVVTMPSIDIVVAAMVGYAGLQPTIEAIKAGKTIALANKETLVVAGEIICDLALQHHTPILPVDSEHSAIFQSLVGEDRSEIEKILLTASGGPRILKRPGASSVRGWQGFCSPSRTMSSSSLNSTPPKLHPTDRSAMRTDRCPQGILQTIQRTAARSAQAHR